MTDLIDLVLTILNVKLAGSAIVLLNFTEESSCCNFFNLLIPSGNWVGALGLISKSLNLMLLDCKLVDKLKI